MRTTGIVFVFLIACNPGPSPEMEPPSMDSADEVCHQERQFLSDEATERVNVSEGSYQRSLSVTFFSERLLEISDDYLVLDVPAGTDVHIEIAEDGWLDVATQMVFDIDFRTTACARCLTESGCIPPGYCTDFQSEDDGPVWSKLAAGTGWGHFQSLDVLSGRGRAGYTRREPCDGGSRQFDDQTFGDGVNTRLDAEDLAEGYQLRIKPWPVSTLGDLKGDYDYQLDVEFGRP